MILYRAMYEAIALHSRLGLNVVVDVGHHDAYAVPRGILPTCARLLEGLPVLFVGVRCPVEVVMQRRRATWPEGTTDNDPVPQAVHVPGIYDLEVDTSVLGAEQCADVIRQRLEEGPPPSAILHLAAMDTEEERAPRCDRRRSQRAADPFERDAIRRFRLELCFLPSGGDSEANIGSDKRIENVNLGVGSKDVPFSVCRV